MASLQFRSGVYRLLFQYNGRQGTYTAGSVPLTEARQWKFRTESLLMRVRQRILEVPRGVSISDFILHDGKPPVDPAFAVRQDTTLYQLSDGYFKTVSNGAIESNTLATARIHMAHIEETVGKKFLLNGLTLGRLTTPDWF